MNIYVIIPAGGSGSRYSSQTSKLTETIHNIPIICHSIQPFITHPTISGIITPSPDNLQAIISNHFPNADDTIIYCQPGKTRAESVANAIKVMPNTATHILIHDAARPNISPLLMDRVLKALNKHTVVIPGVPVTDTIKKVKKDTVQHTVDRSDLIAVQTPQGFDYKTLQNAYTKTDDITAFTDEASLLEHNGVYGHIVAGDPKNIKLTHPSDLDVLRTFITAR
jgi:2-C-methyl-D-erythritol 4-phosphate cytidylyltransferase